MARLRGVLFVRSEPDLLSALDARAVAERTAHPGRRVSRAELARELLYAALGIAPQASAATTRAPARGSRR